MADNDMSFRQRPVIEFLVKEEIPRTKSTLKEQDSHLTYYSAWIIMLLFQRSNNKIQNKYNFAVYR